jgi:hypothetical protein
MKGCVRLGLVQFLTWNFLNSFLTRYYDSLQQQLNIEQRNTDHTKKADQRDIEYVERARTAKHIVKLDQKMQLIEMDKRRAECQLARAVFEAGLRFRSCTAAHA